MRTLLMPFPQARWFVALIGPVPGEDVPRLDGSPDGSPDATPEAAGPEAPPPDSTIAG
jgi:hypothetical protein